ncbi:MAG TPA: CoB--CoM heterodisulfide reductase iron-sulfur subunit A family protein [bacterium]|nr:CoB--CoM heterodisulfide reductase iron-sulfur subunit A family protein [bacterium]
MARIGVYVCHCGVNIASSIDVERVTKAAGKYHAVVVARNYAYMCSDPGQELIRKDIREHKLDRVVVAACSPRMHEVTFRKTCESAGLNAYCFEMTNIREQCSWVHENGDEATAKAVDLVFSSLSRAALLQPLTVQEVPVTPAALIIGGGIAGIQAALDIADSGFQVHLVEKTPSLGGHMARLDKTFPTLDCSACILTPKMVDVGNHSNIHLMTYAEVEKVEGFIGNYKATIRLKPRYVDMDQCTGCGLCAEECRLKDRIDSEFDSGMGKRSAVYVPFPQAVPLKYTVDEEHCLFLTRGKCGKEPACQAVCPTHAIDFSQKEKKVEVDVGTIVVATGFEPFDASRKPELAYSNYSNVITGLEFERLISASGPTGGKLIVNGREPRKVVFIQCVGSRDKNLGNEWCSRVCCMYAIKQAHLIREKVPDSRVTVLYMDLRCFGKGFEEFYDRVRSEGVIFRRAIGSEIYRKGEGLAVRCEDTFLGQAVEIEADLVVLSAGLEPGTGSIDVSKVLKLSRSADGFLMEAHPKLRPVDTATDGVYLAGCCQGPKDIPDTVAQAKAAASSALIPMIRGKVFVEPISAQVNDDICCGCRVCEAMCEYKATVFDEEKGVMTINAALCKGCGSCAGACPTGAMTIRHYTDDQIFAQVESLSRPFTDE